MGFSINNMALEKLLESISTEDAQLPEFQPNRQGNDKNSSGAVIKL